MFKLDFENIDERLLQKIKSTLESVITTDTVIADINYIELLKKFFPNLSEVEIRNNTPLQKIAQLAIMEIYTKKFSKIYDYSTIDGHTDPNTQIIKFDPNNTCTFNPFDIEDKTPREEILGKLTALTSIAKKHGETVTFDLIKELADKNGFDITDDEINYVLNFPEA